MKVGYENLISSDLASASGGAFPSYILDNDSLKVKPMASGEILNITLNDATDLDFLSIFNYDGSSLKVIVTDSASGTHETNLTSTDATGLYYDNYLISLSAVTETITSISFENTTVNTAYIGYAYSGKWIDFECLENMQPFDRSNDDVTINKANQPLYNPSYLYRTYNVTTNKEVDLETLRENIRKILLTGYALKRPFLFDDGVFDSDEIILGVLTSGSIGYDFFQVSGDTLAQCSFEIREVF